MPEVSIVVAMAENRVIGSNGQLPWDLPKDRARLARITTGHVVIMGRKTFVSITSVLDGPLPNRTNIVLSRTPAMTFRTDVSFSLTWNLH
jgi:dihydrofolate reductase